LTSPSRLAAFTVMGLNQQISSFGADQFVEPPDTQLAAGPTDLTEMVNSSASIWTKAGALVSSFDLNTGADPL
jgi:hypothetical protein